MHNLNKLISKDLVVGLPKLKFEKNHICEACQKGKQIKHSFKLKNVVSVEQDALMSPNPSGKLEDLVVVVCMCLVV